MKWESMMKVLKLSFTIGGLLKNLVNIIGGCCGTTPDHIQAFDLVKNILLD